MSLLKHFNFGEEYLRPDTGYDERSVLWFKLNILPDFISLKLPSPLLDVGCAYGYFTKHYAQHVEKVFAVDFAERRIELANKYNSLPNISYLTADVTDPFEIPKVSSAVSSAVIQHIEPSKRKNAFQNIRSLMDVGSTFVLYDTISSKESWNGFFGPLTENWLRTNLTGLWDVKEVKFLTHAMQGELIYRIILSAT